MNLTKPHKTLKNITKSFKKINIFSKKKKQAIFTSEKKTCRTITVYIQIVGRELEKKNEKNHVFFSQNGRYVTLEAE